MIATLAQETTGEQAIIQQLNEADIILSCWLAPTLWSPDYCYGKEMQRAFRKTCEWGMWLFLSFCARFIGMESRLASCKRCQLMESFITGPEWYDQG